MPTLELIRKQYYLRITRVYISEVCAICTPLLIVLHTVELIHHVNQATIIYLYQLS